MELSKIKVANIIEDARYGGPQNRIATIAKELKGSKFEVNVIIPKWDNDQFKEKLDANGISYKELPLHRLTKQKKGLLNYVIFFVYEIFVLSRFLKKGEFNIIHICGGSWQWKGVIAGKLASCQVVWHLNDTKMPWFVRVFFKLLSKKADAFIAEGERVKSYYLSTINTAVPTVVTQAPVNCELFDSDKVLPDPSIDQLSGKKIVTVASINPFKGFEYFIDMASYLNQWFDDLHFYIVGPVHDSQKHYFEKLKSLLKEYALDNVYFYGACSDTRPLLKAADLYVCSSVAEASPTSVWEAMAMGKPIISSDVGDVKECLEHYQNGDVVQIKDGYALAQAALSYLNGQKDLQQVGACSRQAALEMFDIKQCAQKHINIYQAVLTENTRTR